MKDKGKQRHQSLGSSRDSTPDFEGTSQMLKAFGSQRPAATTSSMTGGSASTSAPAAPQTATDRRLNMGSRPRISARKSTGGRIVPRKSTTPLAAEGSTSNSGYVIPQKAAGTRLPVGSRRKAVARKSTGGGPWSTQSKTTILFSIFICSLLFCLSDDKRPPMPSSISAPITSQRE